MIYYIGLLLLVLTYLIVTLLGEEATLSNDQVEGSAGHQQAVAHVTKHDSKQEGEGDDGVRSCRHTGIQTTIIQLCC